MENTTSFQGDPAFQADYNPLQENVKQRAYTRPNVEVTDATPIAEPVFTPRPLTIYKMGLKPK